ncbi:RrF2 family transcriptional regulator [Christensenella tenuis]|jgi:Rrf2 family protein|uniref:Rrf2 family transcriptional regulator n=1 Tax=Christensenella tenuis TaxID=2763033 RepID=A0ABR7EE49_9FIRM|nr:Rrf2 family transcriptional regulator [Christensenella tenuis]MBC5648057.1 Rrf2 family transcriptional regulator [Christensenella tenuis]
MKFQLATDYAIRILCYLYENKNRIRTAAYLSDKLGITYLYFMKLTGALKKAGLINSTQGCNGGYQLARNAGQASLYDVIILFEGEIKINRCLEDDRFCSRDATEWCNVHTFFRELQDNFIAQLKEKRICDLCETGEPHGSVTSTIYTSNSDRM